MHRDRPIAPGRRRATQWATAGVVVAAALALAWTVKEKGMTPATARPRVLFVCVENSCRSQMAEALARRHGGGRVEAFSAGSRPSGRVHPKAIASMAELGCDLTAHTSKGLEAVAGLEFDAVVTMGCGDSCPHIPTKQCLDWAIPDPKEMDGDAFRAVRDLIERRVRELLGEL
jgi:protein-tyrosine-phosphatase